MPVLRYVRPVSEGAAWPALRMEPVNIFTATPRGRKLRQQRLKFWIVRLPRFAAENVFNRRPLVATLKRLDFLHTAAWNRVGTFPSIAGATRSPTGSTG